jgi:catalase
MSSTPGGEVPPNPSKNAPGAEGALPSAGGSAARLVLIATILIAAIGTFAYLGGWLTPNALTPARFVDAFEKADGVHPGFRRNHAKGIGVSGVFESNGKGARLSKAVVFQSGVVPVIGRFSLGGGHPYAADKPDAVRGFGLEFTLPNGEFWRTAMINLPVFPFSTPEAFYEQLVASTPDPKTGAPDPAKMKEFASHHPETARALALIKAAPPAFGFQNSTFHSLNTFRFVNANGEKVPVRWILVPDGDLESTKIAAAHEDTNYLFNALIGQVRTGPVQWRLMVIVGHTDDPTNDPSIPWPADREQVEVGTLKVEKIEAEETSPATDLNFDPLILPVGIEPSDDPFLSARSAIYSNSFTRRAGEVKQRSAITPEPPPKLEQ